MGVWYLLLLLLLLLIAAVSFWFSNFILSFIYLMLGLNIFRIPTYASQSTSILSKSGRMILSKTLNLYVIIFTSTYSISFS